MTYQLNQYFQNNLISNSALNFIDPDRGGCPEKFRAYLDGNLPDEETEATIRGSDIHGAVLEKQQFVVADKIPSEAVKAIIDQLFTDLLLESSDLQLSLKDDLQEYSEVLMPLIVQAGYNANWKPETRLSKIIEAGSEYFRFLVNSAGMRIVSFADNLIIQKCKTSFLERQYIRDLLVERDEVEGINELEIYWTYEFDGVEFSCKSKLDRLLIDHKNKKIHIIDLKTTSKNIAKFKISVEYYKYHRQIALYEEAVRWWIKNTRTDLIGYSFGSHYIIACETFGFFQARIFVVSPELQQLGKDDYQSLFARIKYHMETNDWIYPMEEHTNKGFYTLTVD